MSNVSLTIKDTHYSITNRYVQIKLNTGILKSTTRCMKCSPVSKLVYYHEMYCNGPIFKISLQNILHLCCTFQTAFFVSSALKVKWCIRSFSYIEVCHILYPNL
jgi:hypothetical protein